MELDSIPNQSFASHHPPGSQQTICHLFRSFRPDPNSWGRRSCVVASGTGCFDGELSLEWLRHFERYSARRQSGPHRLLLLGYVRTAQRSLLGSTTNRRLFYLLAASHSASPLSSGVFSVKGQTRIDLRPSASSVLRHVLGQRLGTLTGLRPTCRCHGRGGAGSIVHVANSRRLASPAAAMVWAGPVLSRMWPVPRDGHPLPSRCHGHLPPGRQSARLGRIRVDGRGSRLLVRGSGRGAG